MNDIKLKICLKMLYYLMTPDSFKEFTDSMDAFVKRGGKNWQKFVFDRVYKKVV